MNDCFLLVMHSAEPAPDGLWLGSPTAHVEYSFHGQGQMTGWMKSGPSQDHVERSYVNGSSSIFFASLATSTVWGSNVFFGR